MSSKSNSRRQVRPAAESPVNIQQPVEIAMTPAPEPSAPTAVLKPAPTPSPDVECLLVHDIVSHTLRGGINYMYLGRVDAEPMGKGTLELKIVLQIAMPLDGFLNSFFMLEATVKKMQMEGIVTKDMVNAGRARYAMKDEGGI